MGRRERRIGPWRWAVLVLAMSGCGESPSTSQSLETRQRVGVWAGGPARGRVVETDHYRVFTTVHRRAVDESIGGFLEAALGQYTDLTGLSAPTAGGPMEVYLFATRPEWAALTESRFGPGAAPSRLLEYGGYTHQGVTVCWDIGGLATFAVASHEGMHQFLYRRLVDRLPLWAEEGLAVTAEGFVMANGQVRFTPDRNVLRLADIERALTRGPWLPIDQLLEANTVGRASHGPSASVSYYGQLYALCHFLRHDPAWRDGWRRMIADAATGRLSERVGPGERRLPRAAYDRAAARKLFEAYITADLPAFERRYREHAKTMVGL